MPVDAGYGHIDQDVRAFQAEQVEPLSEWEPQPA